MSGMELVTETRIPDLGNMALADLDRYAEAEILARLLDPSTIVPAAKFQSSL